MLTTAHATLAINDMAEAARGRDAKHPPSPGAASSAMVMAFYAAFDCGTLDRFAGIADGFEARVFGATVLDWPGFLAFGQAFRDGFPNGRHSFDFVVTEGPNVATIGRYRGRHERPFLGIDATGRQVDFVVMHLDRVVGDKIVEHRGIGDINTLWAQLGVSPPTTT
jgi:predicted ester cyclase